MLGTAEQGLGRKDHPSWMCQLSSQGSGKWEWSPGLNSPQGTSLLNHYYTEDLKARTGTVHRPITNSGVRERGA